MNLEGRKQRWRDFYDLSSNVATLTIIDYNHGQSPWPYAENLEKRLDWSADVYHKQLEMSEWLEDCRIPAVCPYTGTEVFAQAFGSRVHYPENNMPFALPMIKSQDELKCIKEPDIFGPVLGGVFEMARRLRQRCGEDAAVRLPDIQSPLDIAALIWEKADFLMTMISDPAAVTELTDMTERTLTRFLDAWFKEFGANYIAHYPEYYMEGGLTLSEDEIGEFSAPMFERFCAGPLNRLSRRFGGIGVHCCAHARHQWGNLKKIEGLRLINLVQPGKVTLEAYAAFENTSAQMHNWCGDGVPSLSWAKNYPAHAHIVLSCTAGSKEEAISKCDILNEIAYTRDEMNKEPIIFG